MSKFEKTLRKKVGKPQNTILLGLGPSEIETASNVFQSVFVFSSIDQSFKNRNVIYFENFNDMAKLPEVNFILINPENIKEMPNITPILKNSKPLVMILSGEYIHKRFSKWLIEEMHYELVELDTHRQLWKKKRLLGQL
jgi:hypothetical protein